MSPDIKRKRFLFGVTTRKRNASAAQVFVSFSAAFTVAPSDPDDVRMSMMALHMPGWILLIKNSYINSMFSYF